MSNMNVMCIIQCFRTEHLTKLLWKRTYVTSIPQFQQVKQATSLEWQNAKPMHKIPSPPRLPIIGHLNIFTKHAEKQHKVQDEIRKKYGNVVRYWVPGSNIVALYSPEGGSAMYANDGKYPLIASFDNFEFFRYNSLLFHSPK